MVGELIGSYKVVSKLGEGGMGDVYVGEHQRIDRQAALKVMLPQFAERSDLVARFLTEARATSRIPHPGIVEIFDCGTLTSGSPYIVMELLRGKRLAPASAGINAFPFSEPSSSLATSPTRWRPRMRRRSSTAI